MLNEWNYSVFSADRADRQVPHRRQDLWSLRECATLSSTENILATYTLDAHAKIKQLENAGMETRQAEALVAAISRLDAELATKQDLTVLKADIWRIVASIAGGAVLLNRFLDWVIR